MDDYVSRPVYRADLRAALERSAGGSRGSTASQIAPTSVDSPPHLVDEQILAEVLRGPRSTRTIALYLQEAQAFVAALEKAVRAGDAAGAHAYEHLRHRPQAADGRRRSAVRCLLLLRRRRGRNLH